MRHRKSPVLRTEFPFLDETLLETSVQGYGLFWFSYKTKHGLVCVGMTGSFKPPTPHTHLISMYHRAVEACGMDYRSSKLWDSYLEWEKTNGSTQHLMRIYDTLLATPTQQYQHYFERCVCLSVCMRERERDRELMKGGYSLA